MNQNRLSFNQSYDSMSLLSQKLIMGGDDKSLSLFLIKPAY